jgi:hypothetical protein
MYLLHGVGNDDREMVGTPESPGPFLEALDEELATGRRAPHLSIILVAPEGRTVTSSCPTAPPAGEESFWVNWNPRYWDNPAGGNCAPRFEDHIIDELIPLVDRSLPTIASRAGRAILGLSLGGYGSFKLALQHPDVFANAGSISGALNILVAPDVQPLGHGMAGTGGAPVPTTYRRPPHLIRTPPGFPYGDPFGAFGDPVADEAYYRGNQPLDLAIDAHATGSSCAASNGAFCLPLRFFHNDGVPTHPEDFTDPRALIGDEALEVAVMPMNQEMRLALKRDGVPFTYQLHAGIHSLEYWAPYIRTQMKWQYDRVSHPGRPLTVLSPSSFDYRSIRADFSVWGWSVQVRRTSDEFLTLWDATRSGVTVTGSGTVTLTTPAFGITAVGVEGAQHGSVSVALAGGRATVTFAIGPEYPTDERAGASAVPEYDRTVRLCFAYRGAPACGAPR